MYTVVWKPEAERELAEIWLAASDPGLIRHAADDIDAQLRLRPSEAGESRSGMDRILLSEPLGVENRVSDDDRLVRVFRVWRFL